jgi:hypothetical protein
VGVEMAVKRAAQAGQGGGVVSIACVNLATIPLGADMDKLTRALQKAYDQFFLPVWGYRVRLYNVPRGQSPRPWDWQFIYMDDADAAGALGYHDLTVNGQPVSKIFVKTTQKAGELVSVTASHELFEMAIDPLANLWAEDSDGTEYAYEMCDPVEEDTFKIDGIDISNFVHPSWFEPFKHLPGTKFDHLGKLSKPFSMTKGGYMIIKKGGVVKNVFGSKGKLTRFGAEDRAGHRSEHRVPESIGERIKPMRRKPALIRAR